MMRECPNIKAIGKEVNQDSLDPNAPKKNPSYGMGARKDVVPVSIKSL